MNDIENEIKAYLIERNWHNKAPADLAKSILIEGAELLEQFQWKNHTIDEINANDTLKQNITNELADVMIYAIELAVRLDIDTIDAISKKLDHNRKKYPADKVSDQQSGAEFYAAQKAKYRAGGSD